MSCQVCIYVALPVRTLRILSTRVECFSPGSLLPEPGILYLTLIKTIFDPGQDYGHLYRALVLEFSAPDGPVRRTHAPDRTGMSGPERP